MRTAEAELPRPSADDVPAYWRALGPERWFTADAAVDAEIRIKFHHLYTAAVSGSLSRWEDDASGALAHVIVLDQFPRNMFRGTAGAFAADSLARAAAGRAIDRGFDREVEKAERPFFYLPTCIRSRLPTRSVAAPALTTPPAQSLRETPSVATCAGTDPA